MATLWQLLRIRGSHHIYGKPGRDAKRHGRSLNAELLAMLADKKEMARRRAGAVRAMKRIDRLWKRIGHKYPNQPDSTALIREDRDNDEPYR